MIRGSADNLEERRRAGARHSANLAKSREVKASPRIGVMRKRERDVEAGGRQYCETNERRRVVVWRKLDNLSKFQTSWLNHCGPAIRLHGGNTARVRGSKGNLS